MGDAVDANVLTLLSTPKPFRGHFGVIQRNAIESWTRLEPRPDIILFGDDEGTAEICAELGLRHVPDVATSDEGTPLISDMFLQGQHLATTPMVCWANADVIFTDALPRAAALAAARSADTYVVGQRTDIDQTTPLPFADGWQQTLVERGAREGEVKPRNWIDWFLFTRGLFETLPPFAIGRPGYDPWLIWKADELGADVVDATRFVPALHQRHDYSHVGSREAVFTGGEAKRNASYVTDWRQYRSIAHATLALDAEGRFVPARGLVHRMAEPKARLAHLLRFTRPVRRRLLGEQATWRRRRPVPAAR
jgi:hypothetical protein